MRRPGVPTAIAAGLLAIVMAPPATALELAATVLRDIAESDRALLLRSGDIVSPRDRVALRIEADRPARLDVRYRGPDGSETALATDKAIGAGGTLRLPEAGSWYEVDAAETTGAVQFVVTAVSTDGGAAAETRIDLILTDFASGAPMEGVAATRGASGGEAGADPALPREALRATPASAGGPSPGAMVARAEAAQTAEPAEDLVTRGGAASIFSRNAPGVVLVVTDEGIGSGSLLDRDGTILTNWHVVQGYGRVGVVFMPPDGGEIQDRDIFLADVVRIDEVADLAALSAEGVPAHAGVIELGAPDDIEIGGDVHAIGHPRGETWTYTRGYVSQLRANYTWRTGTGEFDHVAEVIQTQTPINPGSSGGPLLNPAGLLIGVNSFGATEAEGLNFAVSIRDVARFLDDDGDRLAARDKAAEKAAPAPPDEPNYVEIDSDENGHVDVVGLDWDHNGIPEIYVVDENEDGEPDFWLLDHNENGIFDGRIVVETLKDGTVVEIWFFDEDEDGVPETAGIDYDRDGEVDRYKDLG